MSRDDPERISSDLEELIAEASDGREPAPDEPLEGAAKAHVDAIRRQVTDQTNDRERTGTDE